MTDRDIAGAKPAAPRRKRRSTTVLIGQVLAAAAAEFETSGYDGATTAVIARRADVTETQLFRLFPSKRALFQASVFDPLNRRFAEFNARHLAAAEAAQASRARKVGDYINDLQAFIGAQWRPLMALLVASAFGPESDSEFGRIDGLTDYFDLGAAMMAQRIGADADVDPQLMVRVSFATVLGNIMLRNFLFPERLATDDAVRDALTRFVMHGISNTPAAPA